jgi:hypothetical protein
VTWKGGAGREKLDEVVTRDTESCCCCSGMEPIDTASYASIAVNVSSS